MKKVETLRDKTQNDSQTQQGSAPSMGVLEEKYSPNGQPQPATVPTMKPETKGISAGGRGAQGCVPPSPHPPPHLTPPPAKFTISYKKSIPKTYEKLVLRSIVSIPVHWNSESRSHNRVHPPPSRPHFMRMCASGRGGAQRKGPYQKRVLCCPTFSNSVI